MVGYLGVRAYAELNGSGVIQTVKDVLETMGIPHTEVDVRVLYISRVEHRAHVYRRQ
jgi:hypothetical protein